MTSCEECKRRSKDFVFIVHDHGDPSVGMFGQYHHFAVPFDADDMDEAMRSQYRADLKVFYEAQFDPVGSITTHFSDECEIDGTRLQKDGSCASCDRAFP